MKFVSKIKTAGDSGGVFEGEEYDFGYDLRLARRWKRRRIASENLRLNYGSNKASKKTVNSSNENNNNNGALVEVVSVDSDYEEFLNDMVKYVDVDSDDVCVDSVNDDDDHDVGEVLDPHYKMFLDNLKEVEKSYVLEIAPSNDTSLVVRYEEENDSSNGLDVDSLEELQSKENTETNNTLRSQLDREKVVNPRRVLRSNSRREEAENPRRVLRVNSVRKIAESPGMFLRSNSSWRKTESSREILRSTSMRGANDSPVIQNNVVKREKTESPRALSNSRGENNKTRSVLDGVVKREKAENPRHSRNISRREGMGTPRRLRGVRMIAKKNLMVEKKIKVEAKGRVSCSANGCSSKRCSLDENVQNKCNFGMKSSFVDESYLEFLSSLEKDGQDFLSAPEGGSKMVYDMDEESTSDSEVVILDNDPFLVGNRTPFESSKSYGSCVVIDGGGYTESPCGTKKSQFREILMEILQKPFDIREYEALWRDASRQRPKQGKKELRRRTVSFPIDSNGSNGKSYLDQHNSLVEKINEAQRDRRKILNLLRGFFYWLENLSHEGAFTPWSDSQCLSTLPPV